MGGSDISEKLDQVKIMLVKRRRWIAVTALVVTVMVAGATMLLPNKFRSEATLLIVQQQVSTRFVQTTVPASAVDAVQAMKGQVLSRSGLLDIIKEFDLYPGAQKSMTPSELADMMVGDIAVEAVDAIPGRTEFTTFKISYASNNATVAQAVTARITDLFINENQKARGREATATSNFISDQLRASQRRLDAQEGRLQAFKAQNLGELPEQQASNLGVVSDLRTQLANNAASQNRVQQQRMLLEQQRVTLEASIGTTLERIRNDRAALLTRFTTRHPEVMKKDQEIAKTEALLDRVRRHAPAADTQSVPTPDDLSAAQLDTQVQANEKEGQSLQQEDIHLRGQIAQYQNRLNLTPVRDQQLAAIMSDLDLAKREYSELKNKQLDSQMGATVVNSDQGEQFRLIDPPTVAPRPSSPKRMRISLGGMLAGLILGIGMAFARDQMDPSFHSEEVIKQTFPLPLIVGIPMLRTPEETQNLETRNKMEWVAGGAILLVMFAVQVYVYVNRAGGWL